MLTQQTTQYKLLSFLGKKLIALVEVCIRTITDNIPVLDNNQFAWVKQFEANYLPIKQEYDNIYRDIIFPDISEISEEQKIVVNKNKWSFLPFYIYGNKINENLDICPVTARMLNQIPNLTTAFFSVLQPGTQIKEHRGAYKGYLRFHFGVQVPDDKTVCGIAIEGKTYNWENGKGLIFDDTFLHKAWNNSGEERVVLYVDFIRPMPKLLMAISKSLTRLISSSPYIQNTLIRLKNKEFDPEVQKILG